MNNDPRNPDIPEQEQDSTIKAAKKSGKRKKKKNDANGTK